MNLRNKTNYSILFYSIIFYSIQMLFSCQKETSIDEKMGEGRFKKLIHASITNLPYTSDYLPATDAQTHLEINQFLSDYQNNFITNHQSTLGAKPINEVLFLYEGAINDLHNVNYGPMTDLVHSCIFISLQGTTANIDDTTFLNGFDQIKNLQQSLPSNYDVAYLDVELVNVDSNSLEVAVDIYYGLPIISEDNPEAESWISNTYEEPYMEPDYTKILVKPGPSSTYACDNPPHTFDACNDLSGILYNIYQNSVMCINCGPLYRPTKHQYFFVNIHKISPVNLGYYTLSNPLPSPYYSPASDILTSKAKLSGFHNTDVNLPSFPIPLSIANPYVAYKVFARLQTGEGHPVYENCFDFDHMSYYSKSYLEHVRNLFTSGYLTSSQSLMGIEVRGGAKSTIKILKDGDPTGDPSWAVTYFHVLFPTVGDPIRSDSR